MSVSTYSRVSSSEDLPVADTVSCTSLSSPFGVSVTALMPGPTDTNFFHRAGMDDTKAGAGKKDDPAQVARQGFEALMSGDDHVIAGSAKNKLQGAAAKLLPETAKAAQHRKLTEPGSAE